MGPVGKRGSSRKPRPDSRSIPLVDTRTGARVWCLYGWPCPTCARLGVQRRTPAHGAASGP